MNIKIHEPLKVHVLEKYFNWVTNSFTATEIKVSNFLIAIRVNIYFMWELLLEMKKLRPTIQTETSMLHCIS